MRLTELNPRYVGGGGPGIYQKTGRPCPVCPAGSPSAECRVCLGRGDEYEPAPERVGLGLGFDCPCQTCTAKRTGDHDQDFHLRHYIPFRNPIDGGQPYKSDHPTWERTGDTFDALVLRPSILSDTAKGGCGWHGFVGGASGEKPGEVVTC